MTVYIDVVFFENLLLNYIILVATCLIARGKVNFLKIFFSSTLGSFYAILNYMIKMSTIENMLCKILISVFMIIIAFGKKSIKGLMKNLIMFYLTSLTFGGAAFMLLFLVNPKKVIYNDGHFIGTYPIKIAICGGILGFILIVVVAKTIKNRLIIGNMICELDIFYRNKVIRIKTLVDSGNLLKEPITGEDVIVVEKNSLKDLVDEDILNDIESILSGKWIGEMSEKFYDYKFKVVPFSSLGNDNGVLLGFKPDYIKVYDDEVYIKKNILVGIYDGRLSRTNMYTSLIGLNILKEENNNEYITIS